MAHRDAFFVALLAVLPAAPAQTSAEAATASVVRYYSLEGEVDRGALTRLLRESSKEDANYRLLYGPVTAKPRPKQAFVAVEAPAATSARDVERLLKRGCDGVEELHWTRFDGGVFDLPSILGESGANCIIGMASEMRWFHQEGDRKFFFHAGTKLDADEIASRFHRLFEPFQAGEIGLLRVDSLRQALTAPVDTAAVERALKTIRKLTGVQRAVLENGELVITVELASQTTSGAPPADTEASPSTLSNPCFDLQPLRAILTKEGVGYSRP